MATFLGRGLWVCVGMCMCVPLGVRVCNANASITVFVLLWGLEGARAVFEARQEKEVLIYCKWFLFNYYYYF